ncbi:AGCS family alanine or glycine:cation symporter [Murinocardiopsis flavida]|uniref:AGCS family alanine or glycine:cation symporter n=1 Tax=Murinocardiopsis flavida TaxID=645275 RepID=A0A2P8DDS7_9ACTN|nr:alanine/glycine:cation symporter family protein [Murinocardiopsis flavida]PSK95380.1 AGCS family alanine or glycine:cation symporter [Murinocardiopsis flavida]
MESLAEGIGAFNDERFWPVVIVVLVIASLYFSIRLGLVQFRLLPDMFRALRGSTAADDGDTRQSISSFQAFAVSAAARVGTGNVAGVATAISVGGPGAVMWMWIMALVVGAASFVESTLAQLYKVPYRTGFRGGPAYYMQYGLGRRWMGVLFAITITVTFGFVFNAVQSNTISATLVGSADALGADGLTWLPAAIGIGLVLLTAAVIFGGIKRIANVSQALVPLMALLYLLLGIAVVALNIDRVPGVIALIFTHAFGIREVASAALGTAIIQGVRRGMFSNEGGLGSAPNAGATASVSHPVKQGLVQTLGVYFDTLIVCSITAFIVLVSNPTYGEDLGATMTQDALGASLGGWAVHMLTVILFLLAFTSVLGNYYYGESNIGFLNSSDTLLTAYKYVFLVATFLGAVGSNDLVWKLADTTMGFMALVNLAAIVPLAGIAHKLLKDYTDQRRQGLDPVFTVDRVPDLRNVHCWGPQPARHDTADV